MDLIWIEPRPHRPVLHIVDRGTHFSAAVFLDREDAVSIWNSFGSCWVSIYVGFPIVVTHDYGIIIGGLLLILWHYFKCITFGGLVLILWHYFKCIIFGGFISCANYTLALF